MSEISKKMEVKEVRIWKKSIYEGNNQGRFVAVVLIGSPSGNMEIPLAVEVAERMLEFLAPVIAEFSRRAVEEIVSDITSQVLSLKSPVIEQLPDGERETI